MKVDWRFFQKQPLLRSIILYGQIIPYHLRFILYHCNKTENRMPHSFKTLSLSLLCFTSTGFATGKSPASSLETDECTEGKRHYRWAVRHIEKGGIGYNQGYTTLEGFFAPDPDQWTLMPFLDLRGHVFDNGKMAANTGAGIRGIWGCRAYGLNAYYDYRNTKRLHYNQIGVGLETLGKLWDLRINGYLPVGKKVTSPYETDFYTFSGHSMIVSQKYQFGMKGADAELGFHFGKSRLFDFYAAAGPYYFIGEIGPNVWGGKARLAGTFKEYITVEISDSCDRMFHNKFQGQITLSLPFGIKSKVKKKGCRNTCKLADALVSRMVQPVGRQEIIVVGHKKKHSAAIDPTTGQPYYFVFVDNTSHSQGTYASPYPTLAMAEANSKNGDILYVFPGDGTTAGLNAGIILQDNQKLLGSGISHSLLTTLGTVTIPPQTTTSPSLTNANGSLTIVQLGNSCEVSGFNFLGNVTYAVIGGDVLAGTFSCDGGIIRNNVINVANGSNASGISLIGRGNTIITNNQIASEGAAISLQTILADTLITTISGNTVSSFTNTVFLRNGVDGHLTSSIYGTITNNTISAIGNFSGAIWILGESAVIDAVISDNKVFASGGDGHGAILVQAGAGNIANGIIMNNNIAAYTNSSGIYAQSTQSSGLVTTQITGNNILTPGSNQAGIYVQSSGPDTTLISGNTIEAPACFSGIHVNNPITATISGNNVSTSSSSGPIGIYMSGVQTGTISNNLVSSSGPSGQGVAAYSEESSTLSILNNTISASGSSMTGLYFEIDTGPSTALISKNIVAVNSGNGIDVENFDTVCLILTDNTATGPIILNNGGSTFTLDTSSGNNIPTPTQTGVTPGTCP
jgi:trimeric autotransporter adhesin